MDGKRIQEYLSNEAKALLTIYKQFQTLLPHPNQDAASHKGEDGRYVESLIKEYLKRYSVICCICNISVPDRFPTRVARNSYGTDPLPVLWHHGELHHRD